MTSSNAILTLGINKISFSIVGSHQAFSDNEDENLVTSILPDEADENSGKFYRPVRYTRLIIRPIFVV